ALGFDLDYISCQVWNEPGKWGPQLDHLGLLVRLDDERWFVDVGFGDNCLVPLPVGDGEYTAAPRRAAIQIDTDAFLLSELMPDEGWVKQLRGSFRPAALADFIPRSEYLKSAPDLSWSTKPFATRALDGDGSRITLRRDLLRIRTGSGAFVESPVAESEWSEVLAEHFGLSDALHR
ncbi:MAG: arylamine N-acetyltransferase, partial [Ilumatobacteraceae bacterium]